ncbi:hypothetical protein [Pelagicoccus enzymogenes]|uniref:hypothetical protein n=1 Tax=Pelagicoccus enzymogenes TaxID=2773457 RepID=UPI0028125FAE|nr:hypothetical protein [Pelagicoccus enzymogenes]
MGFLAFGHFDPLDYGEESKAFAVETIETHFKKWDIAYLESRYRKESIDLGFARQAAERVGQLKDSYGKIESIKDVKRTAWNYQAMTILPPSDFVFYYRYQVFAEFENTDIVIDVGLTKEDGSWGIRLFGIKTPLDDAVFVTKNAKQVGHATPAIAPR